jgi:hypothetical protein
MENGKTVVLTISYPEDEEPVTVARITLPNEEARDTFTTGLLGALAGGAGRVVVTDSETGDVLLDEVRPVGPTPAGLVA